MDMHSEYIGDLAEIKSAYLETCEITENLYVFQKTYFSLILKFIVKYELSAIDAHSGYAGIKTEIFGNDLRSFFKITEDNGIISVTDMTDMFNKRSYICYSVHDLLSTLSDDERAYCLLTSDILKPYV